MLFRLVFLCVFLFSLTNGYRLVPLENKTYIKDGEKHELTKYAIVPITDHHNDLYNKKYEPGKYKQKIVVKPLDSELINDERNNYYYQNSESYEDSSNLLNTSQENTKTSYELNVDKKTDPGAIVITYGNKVGTSDVNRNFHHNENDYSKGGINGGSVLFGYVTRNASYPTEYQNIQQIIHTTFREWLKSHPTSSDADKKRYVVMLYELASNLNSGNHTEAKGLEIGSPEYQYLANIQKFQSDMGNSKDNKMQNNLKGNNHYDLSVHGTGGYSMKERSLSKYGDLSTSHPKYQELVKEWNGKYDGMGPDSQQYNVLPFKTEQLTIFPSVSRYPYDGYAIPDHNINDFLNNLYSSGYSKNEIIRWIKSLPESFTKYYTLYLFEYREKNATEKSEKTDKPFGQEQPDHLPDDGGSDDGGSYENADPLSYGGGSYDEYHWTSPGNNWKYPVYWPIDTNSYPAHSRNYQPYVDDPTHYGNSGNKAYSGRHNDKTNEHIQTLSENYDKMIEPMGGKGLLPLLSNDGPDNDKTNEYYPKNWHEKDDKINEPSNEVIDLLDNINQSSDDINDSLDEKDSEDGSDAVRGGEQKSKSETFDDVNGSQNNDLSAQVTVDDDSKYEKNEVDFEIRTLDETNDDPNSDSNVNNNNWDSLDPSETNGIENSWNDPPGVFGSISNYIRFYSPSTDNTGYYRPNGIKNTGYYDPNYMENTGYVGLNIDESPSKNLRDQQKYGSQNDILNAYLHGFLTTKNYGPNGYRPKHDLDLKHTPIYSNESQDEYEVISVPINKNDPNLLNDRTKFDPNLIIQIREILKGDNLNLAFRDDTMISIIEHLKQYGIIPPYLTANELNHLFNILDKEMSKTSRKDPDGFGPIVHLHKHYHSTKDCGQTRFFNKLKSLLSEL